MAFFQQELYTHASASRNTWAEEEGEDGLCRYQDMQKTHATIVKLMGGAFSTPVSTQLLVVAPFGSGSDYLRSNFDIANCERIGAITMPDSIGKGRSIGELTSNTMNSLFIPAGVTAADCIMVALSSKVSEDQSFEWVKAILTAIKPARVIVLDSVEGRLYPRSVDPCALLKLESDGWKSGGLPLPSSIQSIEAPFLLSGVVAAVMEHCQVYSISAASVLTVRDPMNASPFPFDAILSLLPAVDMAHRANYSKISAAAASRFNADVNYM